MKHYFTNDNDLKPNRQNIEFWLFGVKETLISDDGVFSKSTLDYGSRVMIETLQNKELTGEVLDLGCGMGYIGLMLKKYHPEISLTMADVNEKACQLAKDNSDKYGQSNEVICSDGFENINKMFDVIVSNPPIRTGKKVIYRLFQESYDHLKESGQLYLVIRKQQGAESAIRYLEEIGFHTEVINKDGGYWIIFSQKGLTIEHLDDNI